MRIATSIPFTGAEHLSLSTVDIGPWTQLPTGHLSPWSSYSCRVTCWVDYLEQSSRQVVLFWTNSCYCLYISRQSVRPSPVPCLVNSPSAHLVICPPVHLSIHPVDSSTHLIIHPSEMGKPGMKYIKRTILDEGKEIMRCRQLSQEQKKRAGVAADLLKKGQRSNNPSKSNRTRERNVQNILRSIIRKVGPDSALLCGMCLSYTALSELTKKECQPLLLWLATRGPKFDNSILELLDSNVISAFGAGTRRTETLSPPPSPSPITGRDGRPENSPNERPSTTPCAASVANLHTQSSASETVATPAVEGTGEEGQEDQDLPLWRKFEQFLCLSYPPHSTPEHSKALLLRNFTR